MRSVRVKLLFINQLLLSQLRQSPSPSSLDRRDEKKNTAHMDNILSYVTSCTKFDTNQIRNKDFIVILNNRCGVTHRCGNKCSYVENNYIKQLSMAGNNDF